MNPPTVLSVRIKNDKEGPQTGDVVLNGSAVNEWLTGADYDAGDVVVYENQFYQAKEKHTAGSSFDRDKWEQIGVPDIIVPDFEPNTFYYKNEVVAYGGKMYRAKYDFTSSTQFYDTDWEGVSGSNYQFTSEDRTVTITIDGDTVDYSISTYVDGIRQNLENRIDTKVDQEVGKGLSTNDYTTEDKTKLLNLAGIFEVGDNLVLTPEGKLNAGFSIDFDASLDKTSTNGIQNKPVAEAVEELQNKNDAQDLLIQGNTSAIATNTNNIAQNASDITQLRSDMTADEAVLNTKVDKIDGKELSSNDYTDADQTKVTNLQKIYNIGTHLSFDSGTNTLNADDQSTTLEDSTGQSTTSGMTQKAITDAIADAIAGGIGTLAPVATSGSYNDLTDTPTIDTALSSTSTNAVENKAIKTALDGKADIIDLATVATSGSYNDLSDKPFIPSKVTELTDASNYSKTTDFATVAFSGSYNDLSDTPAVQTIGNAKITIKQDDGSTEIGSFTTNQTMDNGISLPAYVGGVDLTINSSTYVVTLQAKDIRGNNLGTAKTIDLPLESVVVSGSYNASTKKVVLTLKDGSTVEFSIADLISGLQSEITSTNKLSADLVDDTSTTHKFTTAAEKTKLAGIAAGAEVNVQSDWEETDTTSDAYILHKPEIQSPITDYTVGKKYAQGDICISGGLFYRANKAISSAPATLNTSDWDLVGGRDPQTLTNAEVDTIWENA